MATCPPARLYDDDFYAWSRLQARELRRFARTRPNLPLDLRHIAEEIAGLGTERRDALCSWTARIIEHLLLLEHPPATDPRRGWSEEISTVRREVELRLSATLRRDLQRQLPRLYDLARRHLTRKLERHGEAEVAARLPERCPLHPRPDPRRLLAATRLTGAFELARRYHGSLEPAREGAMIRRVLAAIILAGLSVHAAAPAWAENVVRWASASGVLTWDPHGADNLPSFNGYRQVYETLVLHDSAFNLTPGLALSWRLVDPLTWHFVLRESVTFHDGTPLTIEDVVFSLDRARAPAAATADVVKTSITEVQAVDERTVAITTARPELMLPAQMRFASILSKRWAEQHGVEAAMRHDQDAGTHARDHANGTGPFVLVAHETGQRSELVRNPQWWGAAESPHNIDRIIWTVSPDADERLRALLAGEIDFLQDPPLDHLERIRATPGLKLAQTWLPRVVFLGLDQGSAELESSDVRGKNPFRDVRVRRAVYQAIDVEALRDQTQGGLAVPTGLLAAPGIAGYMEELDQRLPYDPDRAKGLLAEAGYSEGFAVRLDCPQTRWNGPALCGLIAEQLGRIGIRLAVDLLPESEWAARIMNRGTDLYLDNAFAVSLDAAEFLRDYHSQPSKWGASGYANPNYDELLERIEGEMITYAREALMEQLWRILLDDVVAVPLFRPMAVWAMHESLELPIGASGIAFFTEARIADGEVR